MAGGMCGPCYQRSIKYGVTPQQFASMYEAQGGRCAICDRPIKKVGRGSANLDHDHKTGAVRGLLCFRCNRGIGFLNDDPRICEAAGSYLRQHGRDW
jgi:hypothetical protein